MPNTPIAVVGVATLFAGSIEKHGFWKNICEGVDLTSEVPPNHWLIDDYYDPNPKSAGKTYCRRGAFISEVPFDPLEYGIPPASLSKIDTAQLLSLVVAKQVLQDACNKDFSRLDRERTSVILGVASATELIGTMSGSLQRPVLVKALREEGLPEDQIQAICERVAGNYVDWTEETFPGLLGNVVAGRIANRFDLNGTNCVVDAACAGSLAALQMAIQELTLGHSDLVITGGVDALNDIFMYMCFSKTPAMSPTEDCRPFSNDADGTLLGEGIGLFALRRLEDAERDGDRIYAVIRGLGSSSDGRSKSIYAPRPEGQAKALFRAYEAAGYAPETVELVEAHGTGTLAGDASEVAALKAVFAADTQRTDSWCALGSVKSQIGHAKAAAGSASLFKIVMALHHKVLPPTIKIAQPNPKLGFEDSPFYLNTRLRPWIRGNDHPRRASASAFGFGGSNFHVTVEEYQGNVPRPPRVRYFSSELLLISAATPEAMLARLSECQAAFQTTTSFTATMMNCQLDFVADAAHRLAMVVANVEQAVQQLSQASALIKADSKTAFTLPNGVCYSNEPAFKGKIAFVFSGQGSQYVDMGADVAMAFDCARDVWDCAANQDAELAKLVFPPPRFSDEAKQSDTEKLRATDYAQPAIGVTSQAFLSILNAVGLHPDMAVGHSFGEVSALHCAGVLSAPDLLRVAKTRGRLMAEASKGKAGAMLAVLAPLADIEQQRAYWGDEVSIANYNSPNQTVLAGSTTQIEALQTHFTKLGVTAKRLPVATAFHTSIVSDASPLFRDSLQNISFSTPTIPVYANATALPYSSDAQEMRDSLAQQLSQPVRFVETIEAMYQAGAELFIEVGPNSVLCELVGRCLQNRPHIAVALDSNKSDGLTKLWQAFARLAVAGVHFNPAPFWDGYEVAFPDVVQSSKATVQIDGANYGKAYPPNGGRGALPAPNPPVTKAMTARIETSPPVVAKEIRTVAVAPTVIAATTTVVETAAAPITDSWLEAVQQIQLQSSKTHQIAQQAMADAHIAYLKTTEELLKQLGSSVGSVTPNSSVNSVAMVMPAYEATTPKEVQPAPAARMTPPSLPTLNTREQVSSAIAEPVAKPAVVINEPKLSTESSFSTLIEIIAKATGFPADMLTPEMELEADLGIDSIKRVEIFATLQSTIPNLPVMDTRELASLQTIGAIAEFVGGTTAKTEAVIEAPKPSTDTSFAILIEIIAKATGFPADMLTPEMELEADLGIDSIKRVEIFATLQSTIPDLPVMDTRELASLQTIGAIAEFVGGTTAKTAIVIDEPKPSTETSFATLIEIIAKATGFPADMLTPEMELEADLGIDSIKRVEIFATLQSTIPDLPVMDTRELASLQTIGAIAEFVGGTTVKQEAVIEASKPSTEITTVKSLPLHRLGLKLKKIQAAGFALPKIKQGLVAIIGEGDVLAEALFSELNARGIQATISNTVPIDASTVIVLAGLTEEPLHYQQAALAAFTIAKEFSPHAQTQGGAFVIIEDIGGDFGHSGHCGERAWLGGFSGLAKTAALEWPLVTVKCIDIERGNRQPVVIAQAIADELLLGGAELEVGLQANGQRLIPVEISLPAATVGEYKLPAAPVLVVSGGARGVTAACVLALAETIPNLKLALLGRSKLVTEPAGLAEISEESQLRQALATAAKATGVNLSPRDLAKQVKEILATREIAANLAHLKKLGVETLYLDCDINDATAVTATMNKVRQQLGRIDGIVHGAGILADRHISDKTPEQFISVFNAKVVGLHNLLSATQSDDLRLLLLFSSVAGRYGNIGQCDYAMANETLNKVASAEALRRGANCLVRAINWGPWNAGMVTPELGEMFKSRGVGLIELRQGANAFVREVLSDATQADVDLVLAAGNPPAVHHDTRRLDIFVDTNNPNYAFIKDHCIQGVPVLPMVMVIEWFARAAAAWQPHLKLLEIQDVRLVKGVLLNEALQLELSGQPHLNGNQLCWEMRLADVHSGAVRYSGKVIMGLKPANSPELEKSSALPQVTLPIEKIYSSEALFHGSAFQLISHVNGLGKEGIQGELHAGQCLTWQNFGWQLDAGLLDGVLQLAILWGLEELQSFSLPSHIARIVLGDFPIASSSCVATLKSHSYPPYRTQSDILIANKDGQILMSLFGVDMLAVADVHTAKVKSA